jgi:predicted nucleic acid-binding protein
MHRFTWRLQNVVIPKKRYPYQRIFADLRFRIDSGKLHCCAFAKLRNAQLMKTERSEGHHEAAKALTLSVLGVMAIILIWNLVMLVLY